MKQVLQNLSNGKIEIVEIPSPSLKQDFILIKSKFSLISSGTEKMINDFANANLINKALKQPDKFKQVIEKLKTDGFVSTYETVSSKLNTSFPIGYNNVGVVIDSKVKGFIPGDRIVSNGNHSEIVMIPKNLCAKIPKNVSDETAAFTVLASVGLQGIRLANPTIGENFVVYGLGIVGLLTIQILKANGCNVIGVDINETRCNIAKTLGAKTINASKIKNISTYTKSITNNNDADCVIITTSSTNNQIIHNSAEMLRKRGRIILIGTAGLKLNRDDFYKKEISFQVSSSYGPGRYDYDYEIKGQDYPIGFVRWTEKRNFETVLNLMSKKQINVDNLISENLNFAEFKKAYNLIKNPNTLGVLIKYNYSKINDKNEDIIKISNIKTTSPKDINLGFIGSGQFAKKILIPNFKKFKTNFITVSSSQGINATVEAKKNNFENASSNANKIINDNKINTVVISTPHNIHSELAMLSLKTGKNVYLEKPLAINNDQLKKFKKDFVSLTKKKSPIFTIGFNRRFAPIIQKTKPFLESDLVKNIIITVNAGKIEKGNWLTDDKVSGGRVVGEVCHFLDLLRFLIGCKIDSFITTTQSDSITNENINDSITIVLKFVDGSVGTIHYITNGHISYPKERIEIFFGQSIIQINNYLSLKTFNLNKLGNSYKFNQDKGHSNLIKSFIDSINEGKNLPIPIDEIFEISQLAINISEEIKYKKI